MKTILFSLLALGINSAFAAPLVEEAICTGKIDGEEMKVMERVKETVLLRDVKKWLSVQIRKLKSKNYRFQPC